MGGLPPGALLPCAVGVLGFSFVVTQLALLRELLTAFSGNEMVLGFVMGAWLLLMGCGTLVGRVSGKFPTPLPWIVAAQVLLGVLPPLLIVLLRGFRNIVFTRGAVVGPGETAVAVLLILLPFCFTGGFTLTLASALLARAKGPSGIGQVYWSDALGSLLGGLLFTLGFVHWLDHAELLLIPAAANLVLASLVARADGRKILSWALLVMGAGIPSAGFVSRLDALSLHLQYPRQKVVARANSAYGNLVVLQSGEQLDFLQNNLPIASSRDDWRAEETVHYAMAQRTGVRCVLLAGGVLGGAPAEILKYPSVRQVDCVELDPSLFRLGKELMPHKLADPRLHQVASDARFFLQEQARQRPPLYDIILLDLPSPSTAQLNRFYTAEFFREARDAMTAEGVLAFGLGDYGNYISPELRRMLGCARATLKTCFRYVKVLPGERVMFLASNGPLFDNLASRLERGGVATRLLKRSYLDTQLAPDRVDELNRALTEKAPLNSDFYPVLYFFHLQHWLSRFDSRLGLLCGLALLGLAAYMAWQKAAALVLFASGFAGIALQLVLLFLFQALCGSVYYQLGIIVSLFMAGLAAGAWLASRSLNLQPRSPRADTLQLSLLAVLIALAAALFPVVLRTCSTWGNAAAIKAVFGAASFFIAALLGLQFPLANHLEFAPNAAPIAQLYTADFLGGFAGAVLTCTFLVPLLGIPGTCYLTAGLNFAAAAVMATRLRCL